jgi:hypothetical protein
MRSDGDEGENLRYGSVDPESSEEMECWGSFGRMEIILRCQTPVISDVP